MCYHPSMDRRLLVLTLTLTMSAVVAAPLLAADDRPQLARARSLYNAGDFDGALAAADEARRLSERTDSADLIAARALLEKFRATASPDDLIQARERLRRVSPDGFAERERLEFVVGLGEALFFDDAPGAAADVFDSVLDSPQPMLEGRDLVLDWWASAVEQDAKPRTEFDRYALYERVRQRMRAELSDHPSSATAAYWSVAAARGQGDLQGAWAAAQAAWVRAALAPMDRGAALRGDIDRLMQRAVIPERARTIGQPPETLQEEWEKFKEKWSR